MPYIEPESRIEYDSHIKALVDKLALFDFNPGHLNYVITAIILKAWKAAPKYATIVKLTGMLVNVKDEFYRRYAGPYEDEKIKENGDVK